MKKLFFLIISCFYIISCNSFNHESVIWKKKIPLGINYFLKTKDGTLYGVEAGKGYFQFNNNGKIGKVNVFEGDRALISNIKDFNKNGMFGILEKSNKEKYIIKIKNGFKLERFVKVDELSVGKRDFLISNDGKSYCGFGAFYTNEGVSPNEWIDIKTGTVIGSFINISMGYVRIWEIDERFYKVNSGFITCYDLMGNELFTRYYTKDLSIPDVFATNRKHKDNLLNDFILGHDDFIYIIPNYIKDAQSYAYYIMKLDKDLNVIGKRRVNMAETYDDSRCISSIYVDEDSYIYIGSDKEMTITKFKPIEDGEDSLVDLRG